MSDTPTPKCEDRRFRLGHGDRLSGWVLLALGLYLAVEGSDLTFGSLRRPGPGFFPLCLAVLLVGLSATILVRAYVRVDAAGVVSFAKGARDVVLTVAGLLLFAAALERVGYVPCTLLVMTLLFRAVGHLRWRVAAGAAAAGTATTYVLFTQLGVPLPQGLLPF
ncbi:MAG: tripartite tricarboxylate transporter TctB family protein [Kiloniellales bacterium]